MLRRTSDTRRRSSMAAARVTESAVKSTAKSTVKPAARPATAAGRASGAVSCTKSRLPRPSMAASASTQRAGPLSTGKQSGRSLGGNLASRASQRLSAVTPQPARHPGVAARAGPSTVSKYAAGRTSIDSTRRQSRVGSGIGTARGRCPDPRPVTDKQFVQAATQRVVNFLNQTQRGGRGYDGAPVTTKDLNKCTGRDFDVIFTFMVGFFLPNFSLLNKKREIEVPVAMKTLGYPGLLTKSHLITIGCAHSWPPLIAALSWLAEQVDMVFGSDADLLQPLLPHVEVNGFPEVDREMEQVMFHWLETYDAWMSGQEASDQEQTRLLQERLATLQDGGLNPTEIRRLEAENKHLQETNQNITASASGLATQLTETMERGITMETDSRRLAEYMETVRVKNGERQKEVERAEQQLTERARVIQVLEQQLVSLREELGRQELSSGDVARIAQQRATVQKQVDSLRAEIQQVTALNGDYEMEQQQQESRLEATLRQLNSQLAQLPAAAAGDGGLELRLRGAAGDQLQQLTDFERNWERAERQARRDLDRQMTSLLHQEKAERDLRGSLEGASQEQFHLEARLRRLEEEDSADRQTLQRRHAELDTALQEVEQQQARVTSELQNLQLGNGSLHNEVEVLIRQRAEGRSDKESQLADRARMVGEMASLALDFKQRVEAEMDRMRNGIAKTQAESAAAIQYKLALFGDKENQPPTQKAE